MKIFSHDYFISLSDQACNSPRLRQHRSVHENHDEHCQRLFNAIEPGSYIRPHCHSTEQGPELLIAVKGFMTLVIFNDLGKVDQLIRFGTEAFDTEIVGVEIPPYVWHSVVAIQSGCVLLEVKKGPFCPDKPKYYAEWAPPEGSTEAKKYFDWILRCIE